MRTGSPAKRTAIVEAALEVFVREGYTRASVDAIAAASGISKRTIYDYYGDKRQLFLETVRETTRRHAAEFRAQLTSFPGDPLPAGSSLGDSSPGDSSLGDSSLGDPSLGDSSLGDSSPGDSSPGGSDFEAALTRFGVEFATGIARSAERAAVMRLIIAEVPHFPELLEPDGGDSVQSVLAERLASLGDRGLLEIPDPMEAAEFFGLLVTGRVNYRSWYGAVPLDDAEIARLATGGVQVFLRAYGRFGGRRTVPAT